MAEGSNSRRHTDTNPQSPQRNMTQVSKRMKILFGVIFGVLALATIAAIVLVPIFSYKAEKEALIRIPKAATRQMVRDSVAKYLGENYAEMVSRVSALRGSDYSNRHGAYLIEAGMSPLRAENRLRSGAQHPVKLVVNGFRTKQLLAEKIATKLDFPADSLLAAMNNPQLAEKYGLTPEQSLALFPDATYEVWWSDSPDKIISRTGENYNRIWTEERRKKARALGLSPAEMMTLCAIVDEETNKAEDKGPIGRLYINRLKRGMKLQADPTVKFAFGDFSLRRIRSEHLKTDSPYNTYIYAGLPPGLIRTTSVATIDSVLNSKPHEFIFMCAKDDFSGYHAFASTYEEHLKNARRYQQALNRRNIQ